MITITKKNGKWEVGDKPTLTIGNAERLVNSKLAEWDTGWNRYGYNVKEKEKEKVNKKTNK